MELQLCKSLTKEIKCRGRVIWMMEIDKIVTKLYGLTDDEIAMIEGCYKLNNAEQE